VGYEIDIEARKWKIASEELGWRPEMTVIPMSHRSL
jgi:hypothetical protein